MKNNPKYKKNDTPKASCFCNNEKDANTLINLVLEGKKTATCGALISYEKDKESLPKINDLWIMTDFYGEPKCVTRTTNKYKDVSQEIAKKEGEGDLSLDYWQKAHWKFFSEELLQYGLNPNIEMELVFDEFEVL